MPSSAGQSMSRVCERTVKGYVNDPGTECVETAWFFLTAGNMAGFEDAVNFASALRLDLSPTDKKMLLKEEFYEQASQGQHLAVLIGKNRHNPWHHGIYAGKEEGKGYVYHMTGDDKSTARIRKDLFSDFAKGRDEIAIVR